jgi:phosphomannomutase
MGQLQFGTAGIRGPLGEGPGCINLETVRAVAAGLGTFLGGPVRVGDGASHQNLPKQIGLAYDARAKGAAFAAAAAARLRDAGYAVLLFDRPVPTPVLAFAVRHLGLAAGLVVTASHNPVGDSGIKLFGPHGGQFAGTDEAQLGAAVSAAASGQQPAPVPGGSISSMPTEVSDAYLHQLLARRQAAGSKRPAAPLRLAYSALHGVGGSWVVRACAALGGIELRVVEAQQQPDPLFPTAPSPNPELPQAMRLLLQLAEATGADLAVANDPDADRLAVGIPDATGKFFCLTGDQIGTLLAATIVEAAGRPTDLAMGTTLPSSRLLQRLCQFHGAHYFETLTGFKWLAAEASRQRATGIACPFMYEEALGFCVDPAGADKDGIDALLAMVQLCAQLKARGQTVQQRLWDIYRQAGLSLTAQQTFALQPGINLGQRLRNDPPKALGGRPVLFCRDLQNESPGADLLIYTLAAGARIVVRPSGTEPKLKCYYELTLEVSVNTERVVAEQEGQVELKKMLQVHRHEVEHQMGKSLAMNSRPL